MRSCSGASGTLLEGRCGLGSACDNFEAHGSKVSADSFRGQTFGAEVSRVVLAGPFGDGKFTTPDSLLNP